MKFFPLTKGKKPDTWQLCDVFEKMAGVGKDVLNDVSIFFQGWPQMEWKDLLGVTVFENIGYDLGVLNPPPSYFFHGRFSHDLLFGLQVVVGKKNS